jgi:hypothetical protein
MLEKGWEYCKSFIATVNVNVNRTDLACLVMRSRIVQLYFCITTHICDVVLN